jgi:hypothetical protein
MLPVSYRWFFYTEPCTLPQTSAFRATVTSAARGTKPTWVPVARGFAERPRLLETTSGGVQRG